MPDINKAYSWAINTCNAHNVGYSQTYRNAQTVGNITYYDCSSFINYALLAGGFETPSYAPKNNAFTTNSEVAELLRLGFTEVDATGTYLAGDIGVSTGHTEMCYRGGKGKGVFMGAHTSNAPLANQVSIGSSGGNPDYERSFPRLFRYGSGGATGYGASAYVVSALAGNAWRESHINPTLSQQGGGAFGIFQWDGSRRDALLTWLSENGYENTNPNGQMQYLVVEDDWQGTFDGISSLTEFLTSGSTDIASLTEAFCTCWERPGKPFLSERIEFAKKAFEYILIHANDTTITSWETEPMYYLSEEQALHNAVLMYRFYSAGGGGGGTPTTRKKKMPIWMWIKYNY
jgi:hypothetical protein